MFILLPCYLKLVKFYFNPQYLFFLEFDFRCCLHYFSNFILKFLNPFSLLVWISLVFSYQDMIQRKIKSHPKKTPEQKSQIVSDPQTKTLPPPPLPPLILSQSTTTIKPHACSRLPLSLLCHINEDGCSSLCHPLHHLHLVTPLSRSLPIDIIIPCRWRGCSLPLHFWSLPCAQAPFYYKVIIF